MTKAGLQEEIETSRITLWRFLSEFGERVWIRETDAGYEATAAGRIVVERIDEMRSALGATDELGSVAKVLELVSDPVLRAEVRDDPLDVPRKDAHDFVSNTPTL